MLIVIFNTKLGWKMMQRRYLYKLFENSIIDNIYNVLFCYENTSTNTEGVYFDMDGNGIKEKMLTWTNPNEWMVVNRLMVKSNNSRRVA